MYAYTYRKLDREEQSKMTMAVIEQIYNGDMEAYEADRIRYIEPTDNGLFEDLGLLYIPQINLVVETGSKIEVYDI